MSCGNQQKNTKSAQENVASIKEVYYENSLVYYLINFNGGGFVIVSADDATKPILGYSDKGTFDTSLNTPQMNDLLNAYKSFVYESAKAQKVKKTKLIIIPTNCFVRLFDSDQRTSILSSTFYIFSWAATKKGDPHARR